MAFLKRLRGKPEAASDEPGARATAGAQADEDAAPAAEDPALHPGHRAGRARLFPDAAVLARRLRGRTSRTWSTSSSTATPTARARRCAASSRSSARSTIPRSASITRACRTARRRAARATRDALPSVATTGTRGTVGAAADALVPARRQRRPLRRRHHRDGSARPARHPGVRDRPRLASGDRRLLLRGRPPDDRRAGVADRLLAGRRPGLQRREGGRGDPRAARRALPRRDAGRVPDARPVGRLAARPAAGRGDDDGRDPRARRRDRLDGVRRPRQRRRTSPAPAARTPARSTNVVGTHDMHSVHRARRRARRARRPARRPAPLRARRAARSPPCIFNFPPNAGNTGTAAFLSVFESLLQHAGRDAGEGYTVDVPASVDALRERHHRRQRRSATARWPTCTRASAPTTTCGARST